MEDALALLVPRIKFLKYKDDKNQTAKIIYSGAPVKINKDVYFPTAQWGLNAAGKKALDEFAENYNGGDIVIEGYTDPRGSTEYNFELGKKRALSAKEYLLRALSKLEKGADYISTISFGEMRATGENMSAERRAVVSGGTALIKRALESSISAMPKKTGTIYFLVDASGSMSPYWDTIANFDFGYDYSLYYFNSCTGVKKGRPSWENMDCSTPLWDSIYKLASTIEIGSRIVVLTDGIDNNSRIDYKDVIKEAKDGNIIISTVYIGDYHKGELILAEIAMQSGGFFYLKAE